MTLLRALPKLGWIGSAVAALTAFLAVPLLLRHGGRIVLIVSVHFGAWLAGVVDRWGDSVARAAMVIGSGVALVLGATVIFAIAFGLALLAGLCADRVAMGIGLVYRHLTGGMGAHDSKG